MTVLGFAILFLAAGLFATGSIVATARAYGPQALRLPALLKHCPETREVRIRVTAIRVVGAVMPPIGALPVGASRAAVARPARVAVRARPAVRRPGERRAAA